MKKKEKKEKKKEEGRKEIVRDKQFHASIH